MVKPDVLIQEINNLVAVRYHVNTLEEAQDLLKSIGIATDEYLEYRVKDKQQVMSIFGK